MFDEELMKKKLESKRVELTVLVDNFCLSSDIVVRKAREFEELANESYAVKDGAYWMQRALKLSRILSEVEGYCPMQYKDEIAKLLKMEG